MGAPYDESWRYECRIDALWAYPWVRARVGEVGRQSAPGFSAEQFASLMLAAGVARPGVLIASLAFSDGGAWVGRSLGLKVTRTRSVTYRQPIGEVSVALLCCLARRGFPLRRVTQGDDGYLLEAVLPRNWQSYEGQIRCFVATWWGGPTQMRVDIEIGGQKYDWGRSNQVVSGLVASVGWESGAFRGQP